MLETTENTLSYVVTGESRVFPFPIPFFEANDIFCFLEHGDEERELVRGSEFTVAQLDTYAHGADITLAPDVAVSGDRIAIARLVPYTQTLDLPLNGKIPSDSMEKQLDRTEAQIQQLAEEVRRIFKFSRLGKTITVPGNLAVSGGIVVSGAAIIESNLQVSSGATISGGLVVSGGIVINGETVVTQPWVKARYLPLSGGTITGRLAVQSGASVSGGFAAHGPVFDSQGSPVVPSVMSLGQDFDVKTFQNGNVDYAQLHLDQGNNPYGEPWYPFVNLGVFSSGGDSGYVCLSGTLHDPSSLGGHHIDLVAQGEYGAYSVVRACPGEANIYVENTGAETPWATVLVNTGEVSLEQGFSGADSEWHGLLQISRGKVFISGYYYDVGGSEFHCSGRPVLDTENPLFRNVPFITTFGGYTFNFATNQIFMSGSGAAINIESGAIIASGSNGESVVLSGGRVSVAAVSGLLVSGGGVQLSLTSGGILLDNNGYTTISLGGWDASYVVNGGSLLLQGNEGVNITGADISIIPMDEFAITARTGMADITLSATSGAVVLDADGTKLVVSGGNVFVNSRPVLTELVASTDSETTSASIAVLSGGTAYTFTQPLTSLSVASIESSMRESWLRFTVASGGSVSINDSGFEWWGGRPSAYEGGSSYSIGVWNGMMVCGELED
jgi:hypothetical protein